MSLWRTRAAVAAAAAMAAMAMPRFVAAQPRAITVEVAAAAPFDAGDLVGALRVRLQPEGPAVHVRVQTTAAGVRVEARGGARDVAVGGLDAAAAARLVALAANDLLFDDLATAPAPGIAAEVRTRSPAVIRPTGPVAVSALATFASWSGPLAGGAIEVGLGRGPWRIAAEVGAGRLLDAPLDLTAASVRLAGGWRRGALELRAAVVAAPVFVSDGAGDRSVLVGAGAAVRLRVPVARDLQLVFAAGLDAYANRTAYRMAGVPVLETPTLAPYVALGVEVAP